MPPLTANKESFAQLVADGANHTQAYRQCYSTSKCSNKTVWHNAYRLSIDTQVLTRIQELKTATQTTLAERRVWDKERLLGVFEVNLEGARESKQWASANGAGDSIGRLTGLLGDKGVPTGEVQVTRIIINLAPGASMPSGAPASTSEVVEATEFHDVEEEIQC